MVQHDFKHAQLTK